MRPALSVVLVLAILALAGCSGAPQSTSTSGTSATSSSSTSGSASLTYNVTIKGTAFVNGTLTIHAGDSVDWANADGPTPHSVTSDAGDPEAFDSSPNCRVGVPLSQVCMVSGDHFTYTFKAAGTYGYHCKVHDTMKATVTVTA